MKQKAGIIFLAVLFLVGLLTLWPYGAHLDQISEQKILYANMEEYLLHLPGEAPSLCREIEEYGVQKISVHEDRDHGMATYYLAFPVWYISQVSGYAGNLFWHTYTFLLVFWGMCSLFLLCRDLFHSEKLSAFIVLLFFLTPRMFAESHYNDKDMILLSLVFTLFYWGRRMMKKPSVGNLSVFAVVGALAANLKIVGIWIFGALGLYILFYFIVTKRFDRKLLAKAVGCILIWVAAFILLTPACWPDMVGYFKYFFFNAVDYDLWHDYVLFNGKMLHRDYTGMPKKYLLTMIGLTVPVGILLLTLSGGVTAVADLVKKKGKCWEDTGYVLMMILVGAVPLAYAVLAATPLYNGWRHFYFVYPSMIVAAGYGAFKIWGLAKRHGREIWAKAPAVLYLAALAVGIALNYPQEHSFYNLLAGGDVLERYELDYWDLSVRQAYESVLKQTGEQPVSVGALNTPTRWGLEGNWNVLSRRDQQILSLAEEWRDADYVIVNTTYAYMYTNEDWQWIRENYELTDSFDSYGNVICEVYARK